MLPFEEHSNATFHSDVHRKHNKSSEKDTHNGEIVQGAYKTKNRRPWIMQMIVHGFPSKLAALQFEWAWQHPSISRHLKDEKGKAMFGRGRRLLKTNVQIARSMVSSHPYNTWPLHVKLFTKDAVSAWSQPLKCPEPLAIPLGLTVSPELEGVDGKSGQFGSGRAGPIDVTDEAFTSEHLKKATAQSLDGGYMRCSVCNDTIKDLTKEPLKYALCPSSGCATVSHLRCLADDFLRTSSHKIDIIPRGGVCRGCRNYVLWGDVIRGCYRRQKGGAAALEDPESEEASDEHEMSERDSSEDIVDDPVLRRRKRTVETAKKKKNVRVALAASSSVSGPPKTGRAKRASQKSPSKKKAHFSTSARIHGALSIDYSSDGEEFLNLSGISSQDDELDCVPPVATSPFRQRRPSTAVLSDKTRGEQRQQLNCPPLPPLAAARIRNAEQRARAQVCAEEPELEAGMSTLSVSSPAASDEEDDIIIVSD